MNQSDAEKLVGDQESKRPRYLELISPGRVLFVGLSVVLVIYYWSSLCNQRSFFLSDVTTKEQPCLNYIFDSLRHGRLSLWNPYMQCGIPYFGKLAPSPINPLELIFAFLPFDTAYAARLILNQLLACMGAYLLVSSAGWGAAAAILCGVTFGLSSLLFSLQNNILIMTTIAFYPILIWSFLRIGQVSRHTQRALYCLLGAVGLYFMLTAAPDLAAIEVILLLLWCLLTWLIPSPATERDHKALVWQLGTIGLGLMLSMPQLLPLAEWIGHSIRVSPIFSNTVMLWSANWYDLLGAILPQPLGDRQLVTYPYAALTEQNYHALPYISSLFLSPVIITLAFLGFGDDRWRTRWLVLAVSVFFLIASMGQNVPVIPTVVQAMHWQLIRFPIKLAIFPTLAMIAAAGRGLIAAPRVKSNCPLLIAAGFWLLTSISAAALLVSPAIAPVAGVAGRWLSVPDIQQVTTALIIICRSAVGMSVLGLAVAGIIYLARRRLVTDRLFEGTCIVAAAAISLCVAYTNLSHAAPADFFRLESALGLDVLREAGQSGLNGPVRLLNLTGATLAPAASCNHGDPTVCTYLYKRHMLEPMTNMDSHIACTILGEPSLETTDHNYLVESFLSSYGQGDDLPMARYCQLTDTEFAVQYVNELSPLNYVQRPSRILDSRYFTMIRENPELNYRLYKVLNGLPRARFAGQIKWGRPHDAVLSFVACRNSAKFDPHELTVLEHSIDKEESHRISVPAIASKASVNVLVDEPGFSRMNVSTPGDDFLILADTFYPGWSARVDGRDTTIFRADGILRAIFVPSGKHSVEFCYWPGSFMIGLLLGGLGLILAIVLAVLAAAPSLPKMPALRK